MQSTVWLIIDLTSKLCTLYYSVIFQKLGPRLNVIDLKYDRLLNEPVQSVLDIFRTVSLLSKYLHMLSVNAANNSNIERASRKLCGGNDRQH
jgi:hypothetical protein